jgi:hypothetical protein
MERVSHTIVYVNLNLPAAFQMESVNVCITSLASEAAKE